MAGYIGSKAVILSTTAAEVAGDIKSTDASPEVTLQNTTEEDTDGGRESTIIFKGEQSGGEISTLAEIEAAHDGSADDEKGDLIFRTNDGADGSAPTERLRIKSDGHILPSVDNASDLGSTEKRFLDLHLSGGVSFDEDPSLVTGSVSSKTLDDYEEGTWTPTLAAGTPTINATSQYTKVGNLVTIFLDITYPVQTNGNDADIFSLPFTSAASIAQGAVAIYHNYSTSSNVVGIMNLNSTRLRLFNGSGLSLSLTNMSGKDLRITAQYTVS